VILKANAKVGERLPVHRPGGEAVDRKHDQAAEQPTDEGDDQGLEDERHHDAAARSRARAWSRFAPCAPRPPSTSCSTAPTDRAQCHHEGDQRAEHRDQPRHVLRLLRVVGCRSRSTESVMARVGGDTSLSVFERLRPTPAAPWKRLGIYVLFGRW